MATREWTGSVTDLPKSVHELAIEFARNGTAARDLGALDDLSTAELRLRLRELAEFMQDHAYTLNEWADAVEQLHVKLSEPAAPGVLTNAQGVEIARRFTHTTASVHITRGSQGIGENDVYLIVNDRRAGVRPFHCGIDPEGRVSS